MAGLPDPLTAASSWPGTRSPGRRRRRGACPRAPRSTNAAISAIHIIPPSTRVRPAMRVAARLTASTATGNRRRATRARPATASSTSTYQGSGLGPRMRAPGPAGCTLALDLPGRRSRRGQSPRCRPLAGGLGELTVALGARADSVTKLGPDAYARAGFRPRQPLAGFPARCPTPAELPLPRHLRRAADRSSASLGRRRGGPPAGSMTDGACDTKKTDIEAGPPQLSAR